MTTEESAIEFFSGRYRALSARASAGHACASRKNAANRDDNGEAVANRRMARVTLYACGMLCLSILVTAIVGAVYHANASTSLGLFTVIATCAVFAPGFGFSYVTSRTYVVPPEVAAYFRHLPMAKYDALVADLETAVAAVPHDASLRTFEAFARLSKRVADLESEYGVWPAAKLAAAAAEV